MPAIRVFVRRRARPRARSHATVAPAIRVPLPSALGSPTVAEVNWTRIHAHGELVGWRSRMLGHDWIMPRAADLD